MIHPPDPAATKAEWRDYAKARRAVVDWESASAAIVTALIEWPPLVEASNALVYLPMAEEVSLQALLDSDLPCRWLTTRTPRSGRTLTIHELGGPLEVHPFGYLQPHATAPAVHPLDVEIALMPGLMFDLWGNRLGRGAGFYDRLLAVIRPDVPLVGVIPADLVVDRLPSDGHDVPMSHLATEEGIVATARA